MKIWQWEHAKNQLSDIVDRALKEGPQRIVRSSDVVVVMADVDYRLAMGQRRRFAEYLCGGPSLDDLDLQRDRSPLRDGNL